MAWAIFHGKSVENRQWNTYHRGEFYVHASKGFNKEHYLWIAEHRYLVDCDLPGEDEFIHGALIGKVNLVRVMKKTMAENPYSSLSTSGRVFSMGDIMKQAELDGKDEALNSEWFWGEFGFVLSDPELLEIPIPCRGMLNFFEPELPE